jgi:hypothetical protein
LHITNKKNNNKMKQFFKSIAALTIIASLFTACSKDPDATTTGTQEPGAPTLTVTAPTGDLTLGFQDLATFKFSATPASGAKIKSILITRKNLTSELVNKIYGDSVASLADSTSINRTAVDTILPSIANIGDKLLYTIVIVDDKGKFVSKGFSVTVKDLYVSGQFSIGAQANTTIGPLENKFFGFNSSVPKTVEVFKAGIATPPTSYPSTADSATRARFNSSKVDMLFFFSTANGTGLYSPNYNFLAGEGWITELGFWSKKNSTIFLNPLVTNISQSEFADNNFKVEEIIDKLDFTQNNLTAARNLIKGTVVAFKAEGGAKGLILVEETASDNKSYATFSVKWKK